MSGRNPENLASEEEERLEGEERDQYDAGGGGAGG